jgi:hypothetical protein
MKAKAKWITLIAFGVVIAFALFPVPVGPNTSELTIRNLSNAHQIGFAVRLFTEDHEGRFPIHLSELVPDYLLADSWHQLLYRPDGRSEAALYDWIYFGGFFDEKNPPPILIASPQECTVGKRDKRVIVHGDISAMIVREEEYQAELKKTIEAMHQRRASLPPPATIPAAQDERLRLESEGGK